MSTPMRIHPVAEGAIATETCEAIPASGRRWEAELQRPDIHCGARSISRIEWDGVIHCVCLIHYNAWEKSADHDRLATKWGWNG
jgi:hypothetical protein